MRAPRVSIFASISSSRIPSGVHGTNRGAPMASKPDVHRVKAVDVLERVDPLDDRALLDVAAARGAERGCRGPRDRR